MVVAQELQKISLQVLHTELREVTIAEEQLSTEKIAELKAVLSAAGFELIGNRKGKLIEQIKNLVVQIVHYSKD